jgi:archaellin
MRARTGLGLSFQEWMANPQFAKSWAQVSDQIKAEGGDPQRAMNTMETAVNQMSTMPGAADIYGAAAQYTMGARTVLGAVSQVEGLIDAANRGAPVGTVVQMFTGTLMGTLAAAGVATAGVGAAVVAGAAIVGALLDSWLGVKERPGMDVCGVHISPAPPCVLGCVTHDACTPANIVSDPHSYKWRHFPNPNDPVDAGWYAQLCDPDQDKVGSPVSLLNEGDGWRGAHFWPIITRMQGVCLDSRGKRAIDEAFGEEWTQHVENLDKDAGIPTDFAKAYQAAWKSNQEYWLNGLKAPASSVDVLRHALLMWNTAHDRGAPWRIRSSKDLSSHTIENTYLGGLIDQLAGSDSENQVATNVDPPSIWINTGEKKKPPVKTNIGMSLRRAIGGNVDLSNVGTKAGDGGTSTGTKWFFGTLVVAGLTAGGVFVYSRRTHQSYVGAWKTIGHGTVNVGKKVGRGTANVSKKAWGVVKKPFTKR